MERIEKIIACFKEIGFKPKINEFQDRLVIQKAVCLLDLMGLQPGHTFSLYVRGPYSPDLANDLYNHQEAVQNLKSSCTLSKNEREKMLKVYDLSNHLEPKLLEIMATYSFLWKKMNMSARKALIYLKKLKPYPETQIVVGVSRAKQLLPPTEKEIEEMKAEFKAWEDASDLDARYE